MTLSYGTYFFRFCSHVNHFLMIVIIVVQYIAGEGASLNSIFMLLEKNPAIIKSCIE